MVKLDVTSATSLDNLLEPFSQCMDVQSALRVTEFQVDQRVQARVETLAEKANQGVLSEDEHAEYESLVNAADLISILKLKAKRRLKAAAGG